MTELFIIPREVWECTDEEEIYQTCLGLKEMGLYHLPFEHVAVSLPLDAIICNSETGEKLPRGPGDFICYLHEFNGQIYGEKFGAINLRGGYWDLTTKTNKQPDWVYAIFAQNLIALLATRNIVKETKPNKRAALGIGKKHNRQFSAVTYIRLPNSFRSESSTSGEPGRKRRAHLRRGHIRQQHFGRGNALVKKIWIEPIFVNADENFISSRKAYKLEPNHDPNP